MKNIVWLDAAPVIQLNSKIEIINRGLYKIIYYHQSDTVYIFAIWDCRQNPNVLIKKLTGTK